jgi:hypothetical protein
MLLKGGRDVEFYLYTCRFIDCFRCHWRLCHSAAIPFKKFITVKASRQRDSAVSGSPDEVKIMLGMMLADMAKNQLSTDLSVPRGAGR